jgi:hypothetical protein
MIRYMKNRAIFQIALDDIPSWRRPGQVVWTQLVRRGERLGLDVTADTNN